MKSIWDTIFNSPSEERLSDDQSEQALRELAAAVADVNKVQASLEHERINKLIEQKLADMHHSA
jgi:hypothetical protein